MKFFKFYIKLIVLSVFVPASLLWPQMSSDNFALTKYVVDMAGSSTGSANYAISQSVGQPTPPGQMGSTNFGLINGFWAEPVPQQGLSVWMPDTSASPGAIIDIPVYVEDLTGQGILSLTFSIQADTAILKPVMAIVGGTLLEQWGAATSNISGDTISISSAGIENLSGSGTLILIRYQVNPLAAAQATTSLHFTSFEFNEGTPLAAPMDGSFTVGANFSVSGFVKYYSNENGVPQANAQLDGFSQATDNDGYFEIANVGYGDYSLKIQKDNNYDNAISAFDASFILRYTVGLISLTPYQLIAGDVTGNGGVSSYDAAFILQYVVDIIDQFPIGERWEFIPDSFPLDQSNWTTAPDSLVYAPLNANMSDQNFHGVVYGDLSGNWSAGPGTISPMAKVDKMEHPLEWGKIQVAAENHFKLPLRLTLAQGISSVQIALNYDANELTLDSLRFIGQKGHFLYQYNDKNGALKIAAAFCPRPSTQNINLMLHFHSSADINQLKGSIFVEKLQFDETLIALNVEESEKQILANLPVTTKLYQNYPNPFNPSTTIEYQLHKQSLVVLKIYDVSGREVFTLEKAIKSPGKYCVVWDGKDSKGNFVASGIYFYELRANNKRFSRKLVFMH